MVMILERAQTFAGDTLFIRSSPYQICLRLAITALPKKNLLFCF